MLDASTESMDRNLYKGPQGCAQVPGHLLLWVQQHREYRVWQKNKNTQNKNKTRANKKNKLENQNQGKNKKKRKKQNKKNQKNVFFILFFC